MAAHLQDLQRSFLRHLRAEGRSTATLRLYGQAVTFSLPLARIPRPHNHPRLKIKPVSVITDMELAALLKACAGKDFNDRRDEALVRLLLDCGVRVPKPAACESISLTSIRAWRSSSAKATRYGRSTSAVAPHARSIGPYMFDKRTVQAYAARRTAEGRRAAA
jgi:hypothetical protein